MNPELLIEHGACEAPAAAQPSDIISGSLSKLALVEGCDPTFDCTQLIDLSCERANYAFDRVTLDGEGHRLDARFYLARPAGRFTSWGDGQLSNGRDLFRFFFTPSTASGLDVVDACPPGAGSPADGPGSAVIGKGQRQFSFDVDAWSEENYQHWIDRALP